MGGGTWRLLATIAAGLDNQCKDTLYTTHWYGKNDIQTFNSIPEVKANLKYCVKCALLLQRSTLLLTFFLVATQGFDC